MNDVGRTERGKRKRETESGLTLPRVTSCLLRFCTFAMYTHFMPLCLSRLSHLSLSLVRVFLFLAVVFLLHANLVSQAYSCVVVYLVSPISWFLVAFRRVVRWTREWWSVRSAILLADDAALCRRPWLFSTYVGPLSSLRFSSHSYLWSFRFLIVLFPSAFLGRGSRRFVPYTRPCLLLARGRHPVAFRLYLSGTACLLVAQPLYIKRQGAWYRALCRRGGLTVENEASASYADLSPNQYDVVAPLFTFIPLLRPLSRTLAPFLSASRSLSLLPF